MELQYFSAVWQALIVTATYWSRSWRKIIAVLDVAEDPSVVCKCRIRAAQVAISSEDDILTSVIKFLQHSLHPRIHNIVKKCFDLIYYVTMSTVDPEPVSHRWISKNHGEKVIAPVSTRDRIFLTISRLTIEELDLGSSISLFTTNGIDLISLWQTKPVQFFDKPSVECRQIYWERLESGYTTCNWREPFSECDKTELILFQKSIIKRIAKYISPLTPVLVIDIENLLLQCLCRRHFIFFHELRTKL